MPVMPSIQSRFFVGVDVGKVKDPPAMAVMELRSVFTPGPFDPFKQETGSTSISYRVRHLERLKLGTPYPALVDRVAVIAEKLRLPVLPGSAAATAEVIVDVTGVGRPIFDLLADRRCGRIIGVNFTGGDRASRPDKFSPIYNVPKKDLVAGLVLLFQSRRLQIAEKLADAQVLVNELVNFQETLSAAGHSQFGNDGVNARHDDYVSAAALCCWRARQYAPRRHAQGRLL
jgi:hypothetical protein